MKDKDFQELLEQVRKEFNRRLGKKMCSELYAGCFDCDTRICIAMINQWIDTLEPFKPTK